MATDVTIRPLSASPAPVEAAPAPRVRKVAEPAQKFESFVLQTFIQEMMPDTAEGVYGSGIAGDFWKSMMAEKIAEQVAERGSVGIANYINGAHAAGARPVAAASAGAISQLSAFGGAAVLHNDPTSGLGE